MSSERRPFRIREWMKSRKISVTGIAAELNVHHSLVSATIHGRKNNKKVLNALIVHGCPSDLLALPETIKQ